MREKENIRRQIWKTLAELELSSSPYHSIPSFKGQKQAAKRIRTLNGYKEAKRIFIPPDTAQYEARLHILQDGKSLVMATPRLKDGFYEVDQSIKEDLWPRVIKSSGIRRWGKKLKTDKNAIGKIDLLITGAVGVGLDGERIGKGSGYFDWEYAILREVGCIDEKTPVIAVVHDLQVIDQLPWQDKDVSVDIIVTPTRIIEVVSLRTRPSGIEWKELDKHNITAMRPLRELAKKRSL